jgi:ATP-dependent Clp protease ATP-binding subunit ClpC
MADLSLTARLVWKRAAAEAAGGGSPEIHPVHLLAALAATAQAFSEGRIPEVDEEGAFLSAAFTDAGHPPSSFLRAARNRFPKGRPLENPGVIHRSVKTRHVFERAASSASGEVSSMALLSALLEAQDRDVHQALSSIMVVADRMRACIQLPASDPGTPPPEGPETATVVQSARESDLESDEPSESLLEQFGRDLTEAARQGSIPEIIGRRAEILETIQALARKKKNNPVLVGDPGVGKSAIVEALALRAIRGKDPQVLGGRRIIELSMASLLAGTSLRGQFEERLTGILEEASADPNVILFIDEIHTIMGTGSGASGAANLLKPAMARGSLKLIGATTIDEYRRFIEKDPALDRRFEKILIDQPSREDTIAMLKGVAVGLSRHHSAVYGEDAIESAVDLSVRLDVDHRLPDKAIDLLDRAGAQATVAGLSMSAPDDPGSEVPPRKVGALDIASVLARKLDMPVDLVVGHLQGGGGARLLGLEDVLKGVIRGQDEAVRQVSERMILAHAPVMERRGPLATMLFLGPSGVGKTELAKQLSHFLFGSEKNLIRLDMSEYMGEHTVSKLIGSPPGYVGSEEEGQLTRQIRSKPYSIVLLDEVEKAHPRVYDLFLQVFDEGRLTDARGRLCDARNCIFVLTTNIRPDIEEGAYRAAINEALKSWFRPELINRIDDIIAFTHLSADSIRAILDELFARMQAHVNTQYGVHVRLDDSAATVLVRAGYQPEYGAREMRRTLEQQVQKPLARLLLTGELAAHPHWVLRAEGSELVFRED